MSEHEHSWVISFWRERLFCEYCSETLADDEAERMLNVYPRLVNALEQIKWRAWDHFGGVLPGTETEELANAVWKIAVFALMEAKKEMQL